MIFFSLNIDLKLGNTSLYVTLCSQLLIQHLNKNYIGTILVSYKDDNILKLQSKTKTYIVK